MFVGFGVWLLLGLQFALAADIVGSLISPSWNDIGQLAAIAVIRTFLNYFLEKDLNDAADVFEGRHRISLKRQLRRRRYWTCMIYGCEFQIISSTA